MRSERSAVGALDENRIKSRIHEFILSTLLAGEEAVNLTDTTPLVSGGIIDSINSLKVGVFLEHTFAVKIAPEDLTNPENLETIPAIVRLVRSRIR